MKRNLGVERLYPLGDFKNIKFTSVLNDVPEELALNEEIVGNLFFIQSLTCDLAYRKYFAMLDRISKENIKDVITYQKEERAKAVAELKEQLTNTALGESELEALQNKLATLDEEKE